MTNRACIYILAACLVALAGVGGIDQATLNALKVQHILKKIERHPPRRNAPPLTAQVTQKELNAYIGYCLTKEKNAGIDSLKIVLLNNNRVTGKLRSNAEHLNLGLLFGDLLDIEFSGVLRTKSGKGRLDLSNVQLNSLSIRPQLLDQIIDAAAQYNGTETGSINDWYDLPKGVKQIHVSKGKAVLHY